MDFSRSEAQTELAGLARKILDERFGLKLHREQREMPVYALIVAISTSNSFIIASANPVLTIVAGPGNYRARDFIRVGAPLTLLLLVVLLVSVNLVFR